MSFMEHFKPLNPEDVKVGDIYFAPEHVDLGGSKLRLSVGAAVVVSVDKNGFNYTQSPYGEYRQEFKDPIRGVLVKQREEGGLELLMGREDLKHIEFLSESPYCQVK